MNANSKIVYNYVKENESKNLTAADIAEGTGLGIKSVNGIVTAAFQSTGAGKLCCSCCEQAE